MGRGLGLPHAEHSWFQQTHGGADINTVAHETAHVGADEYSWRNCGLWTAHTKEEEKHEVEGAAACTGCQLPTHPPKPCGIRVGELGVKSSVGQQGGKAIIDNKLIFPSRVSFAHNGNWWVLSPSLSQPRSFLILFFPPIPLRQGSEWVAWWAPGCEQELTWQSVSLGKKTTYEPSSKTLLSQTFHLNFKGMHTHEFENKWNIVYL